MCSRNNPTFCIIPPFVLREIEKNGTAAQQEHARQNLASSWRIRGLRSTMTRAASIVDVTEEVTLIKERLVYDAEYGTILPGSLVRGEGDPPVDDVAVNEAYDGAGVTYDLFKEIYGRNSIDDKGMAIESSVHYSIGYDNAFWNGRQMVYGDGDEDLPEEQRLFNRFTICIDIIGHELTHGVTQSETAMLYRGQTGALNESLSDVFGILVKQYSLGLTAKESNWLVGEGLFTANINGVAIRSLKEPGTAYDDPVIGKDPQPGHMRDYVETTEDNGGVHINSGIPNRAFYVTAVEMGGYAWEKAGQIWYVTLRDKLSTTSDFSDMARLTVETAGELYGLNSLEEQAVRFGWSEVGLAVDASGGGNGSGGSGGNGGSGDTGCLQTIMSIIGIGRR